MNTSCLQQDDYDSAFKAFETKYTGLARVLLFSTSKKGPNTKPKHNMKSLKYLTLIGALCVGLTTLSRATVTQIGDDVDLPNSGDAAELQGFIDAGGDADAVLCAKLEVSPGTTDFGGIITFSVNADDNTLHVTWDMTGTGQLICGFLTKDGAGTIADIFSVAPDQGTVGSADLEVPGNGASALSHLTVFCCEGVGVPDGGATVMLLGAALGGLGMVRRYLKR
jgi:VPDSG-CTERM motif